MFRVCLACSPPPPSCRHVAALPVLLLHPCHVPPRMHAQLKSCTLEQHSRVGLRAPLPPASLPVNLA